MRFLDALEKIAGCLWWEMMKRIETLRALALMLALGGSLFLLHAQGQSEKGKPDGATRQGAKSAFESVCAACHGLDGRGGERGPDVVSRGEILRQSDAYLLGVVREGRPSKGMPAFASLGDKQLAALVAYLRELQGAGKPKLSTGDPLRGRELFFGKAKCSGCHMVKGNGGFFGADLTGFGAKKSADELRTAILSPDKDRDPRKGPLTVKLADGTILAGMPRNEDNFSLQLQTSDGAFHLLRKSDIVSLTRSANAAASADHGRSLSAPELNDLIGFLERAGGEESAGKPESRPQDGDEE